MGVNGKKNGKAIGYADFLARKSQLANHAGFKPLWMPKFLFDFQAHLCDWNIRMGRSATFSGCGTGKTPMMFVFAENVIRKTNKPFLIATPLAVTQQMEREAAKFGIDAKVSRNGLVHKNITITNYERLHYFKPDDFAGMGADESSCIKDFKTDRKRVVVEFMRTLPYRLMATATAAPNDYWELGTSSEALGLLGFRDMITTFFRQETSKDHLGWGRTKYRFRGHAEQPFWSWVCSWARSLRKPSDLGFADDKFDLPPLNEATIIVQTEKPRDGMLFSLPAQNMQEERAERRHSLKERCEKAAEVAMAESGPSALWCELNQEGDMLESMLDDCVQVSGDMSDDAKEEALNAFTLGQVKRIITKPKIGAWGLNWQHCANVIVFPSHSFEGYYQLVRRCWRFGQTKPVTVTRIICEGEQGILANLERKQRQAERMFDSIVAHMKDAMHLQSGDFFTDKSRMPAWIS